MTTAADLDRELAEARARNARLWETLSTSSLRDVVETVEGPMTVVGATWGRVETEATGEELADLLQSMPYVEVAVSSDGRSVPMRGIRWHRGEVPATTSWVYYERWTAEGRVAHGYVHPETRDLIQAG